MIHDADTATTLQVAPEDDQWGWIPEVEAETGLSLSDSQRTGLMATILALYGTNQGMPIASIGGYAGTGKTTLLRFILRWVARRKRGNTVVLLAPTGKAASRMRTVLAPDLAVIEARVQGVEGPRTVHSFTYGQGSLEAECPKCRKFSSELHTGLEVEGGVGGATAHTCPHCSTPCDKPIRSLKHKLAFGRPLKFGEGVTDVLIVVDEASMLDEKLVEDLTKTAKSAPRPRILYLGDPGQLPPVMGSAGVRLDGNATVRLTEIHRQQAGNPIIQLAAKLRSPVANPAGPFHDVARQFASDHRLEVVRQKDPVEAAAAWLFSRLSQGHDATVLSGTHATRQRVNRLVRARAGWATPATEDEASRIAPTAMLYPGERILMLANAHEAGMMNGETFQVASVRLCEPTPYSRAVGVNELEVTLVGKPDKTYRVFPDLMVDVGGSRDGGGTGAEFALRVKALRTVWMRHFDAWQEAIKAMPNHPAFDAWTEGNVTALTEAFVAESGYTPPGYYLRCTWGYALTTHKSQGSEWAEVGLVLDHGTLYMARREDGHRLLYTAVTRASQNLRVFL